MLYLGVDLARDCVNLPPASARLRRHEFWAVDDVSFQLRRGECLGLIGPNGSGKSTLLRVLNGIIRPDVGRVRIRGNVGALIQVGAGFHPKLTGRENVYISGAIRGLTRRQVDRIFDDIVTFAGVGEFIDMPVAHYSTGMYMRLGYAVAAHIEPDILLMDEVLAVGDAGFWHKCLNHMERRIAAGCSPVFVTHSMGALATICTRVMVLDRGRVVYDGGVDGGIAAYQKAMWTARSGDEDGVQNIDPRVTLADAAIVSHPNGRPVQSGDDIQLRLRMAVHRPVGRLRVMLRLESVAYGTLAVLDSESLGRPIPGDAGERTIGIAVPALPLLPGFFSFRLIVLERDTGTVFFRQFGALPIQVVGRGSADTNARLLLALNARWELEGDGTP